MVGLYSPTSPSPSAVPGILCIITTNNQSADYKRTLKSKSKNKYLRTEKSISRWYIKIEFDSQNNILVDKFLERFCFGSISLVKKAVVILLPFCHLKCFYFFTFYLLPYFFICSLTVTEIIRSQRAATLKVTKQQHCMKRESTTTTTT